MRSWLAILLALSAPGSALAQPASPEFSGDVPIESYLALLAQVAPPARDSAEAYLGEFKARCGRALTTLELRKAFAQGTGDPVLFGMIRASHQRDVVEIQRLGAAIACNRS